MRRGVGSGIALRSLWEEWVSLSSEAAEAEEVAVLAEAIQVQGLELLLLLQGMVLGAVDGSLRARAPKTSEVTAAANCTSPG